MIVINTSKQCAKTMHMTNIDKNIKQDDDDKDNDYNKA